MTDDQETQALDLYRPPAIVTPLVDAVAARNAIRQYEALKAAIAQPSDFVTKGGRTYLKKAFWRRVARFFGLSLELVTEDYSLEENGQYGYSVIYRATAPNGQSMTGDGMCMSSEKDQSTRTRHNVRATAHTRAKNRAISDLVGGGEVSAEEIDADDEPERPKGDKRAPEMRFEVVDSKPYNPLQDLELRQRLNKLGYRSVKQVEELIGSAKTRAACFEALAAEEAKAEAALEAGAFGTRGV